MYEDTHIQLTNSLHNMEQEQTTFFGESSTFLSIKAKRNANHQTVLFIQLSSLRYSMTGAKI